MTVVEEAQQTQNSSGVVGILLLLVWFIKRGLVEGWRSRSDRSRFERGLSKRGVTGARALNQQGGLLYREAML